MTLNEVHEAITKIGCLSVTTLDNGTMHSRIISICGGDDEGIYFLTMNSKPFYRQLTANPQVAMCGIYPDGKKTGKMLQVSLTSPPDSPSASAARFAKFLPKNSRARPKPEMRFTDTCRKTQSATPPYGCSVSIEAKGKFSILTSKKSTATTSSCVPASPLAARHTLTQVRISLKTVSNVETVSKHVPSMPSNRVNRTESTVPVATNAGTAFWPALPMPSTYQSPCKNRATRKQTKSQPFCAKQTGKADFRYCINQSDSHGQYVMMTTENARMKKNGRVDL